MSFNIVVYACLICIIQQSVSFDLRRADTVTPVLPSQAQNVDSQILDSIFGAPASAINQQFDNNKTLFDPNYVELNEGFIPSTLEYEMFDWNLIKRIGDTSDKNVLLSPLGLKLAMAILNEAATSTTRSEIELVFGFDRSSDIVRAKYKNIIDSLNIKSKRYILDLGSRIYIVNDTQPRQKFAAIASTNYDTEIRTIDSRYPQRTTNEINAWVYKLTHGKIKQLVTDADVAGSAMMVLNTLFFEGAWRHQFNPNETYIKLFHITGQKNVSVPFMRINNKFYYTESTMLNARIIRLPYLGHKFSMYIIMPNTITGISKLIKDVTASQLKKEIYYMREMSVDLSVPKFNFKYSKMLNDVLMDLGVKQAFEDTASFPGIARGQLLKQRLKISKILQKSGIDVNELGSIAYAATEVMLVNKFGSDEEDNREMIVDRPFMFYIEDETIRQILFTGVLNNPQL